MCLNLFVASFGSFFGSLSLGLSTSKSERCTDSFPVVTVDLKRSVKSLNVLTFGLSKPSVTNFDQDMSFDKMTSCHLKSLTLSSMLNSALDSEK